MKTVLLASPTLLLSPFCHLCCSPLPPRSRTAGGGEPSTAGLAPCSGPSVLTAMAVPPLMSPSRARTGGGGGARTAALALLLSPALLLGGRSGGGKGPQPYAVEGEWEEWGWTKGGGQGQMQGSIPAPPWWWGLRGQSRWARRGAHRARNGEGWGGLRGQR